MSIEGTVTYPHRQTLDTTNPRHKITQMLYITKAKHDMP